MSLTLITVHATPVSSTADAIASVDIPEDGKIMGVEWTVVPIGAFQSGDALTLQLSFIGTGMFGTNDARGLISMCGVGVGVITTSGMAAPQANKYSPLEGGLEVSGGERIHMHSELVGAATISVWAIVQLESRTRTVRRSRRRR